MPEKRICLILSLFILFPLLSQGQKQAKGKIINGARTGVWEFYGGGKLEQKYDYSKNELLFTSDTGKYCSIKKDNEWVLSKVDRRPVMIGGIQNLVDSLALKVPRPQHSDGLKNELIITFVVDTIGEAGDFHVLSSSRETPDTETINYAIYRLSSFWVPALLAGRKVEAHLNMPIGEMYY